MIRRTIVRRSTCRPAIRKRRLIKIPYTKIINGKAYTFYRYQWA